MSADVVSHQAHLDRSVDIGRSAMALQVNRDDLVVLGQAGKDRPEHLAGAEPAVKQDHRPPGTMPSRSRD